MTDGQCKFDLADGVSGNSPVNRSFLSEIFCVSCFSPEAQA